MRSKILAMEGNPPSFRAERKNLRTFYSRESNQLTRANPFSVGTVDKMVERILGFMYFCLNIKAMTTDISLSLFNYVHLFTSYIEYLRDTGSSCRLPHTVTNFLTVAINVVKFNLVQVDQNADTFKAPQVQSFRAFQRQQRFGSVGKVDKMVERILGFMNFCMNIKALTTDTNLFLS